MPLVKSEGSIFWGGAEHPSMDGLVEVPAEALSDLAPHGLVEFVSDAEPAPEPDTATDAPAPRRPGRPRKNPA